MKTQVTNWSNYPIRQADLVNIRTQEEAVSVASKSFVIPRGLGRCYGDASLAETIISTERFNHLLSLMRRRGHYNVSRVFPLRKFWMSLFHAVGFCL